MVALSKGKKRKFGTLSGLLAKTVSAVLMATILASCGGGDKGYSYTVSGTVSGLVGSGLVLQNNAGDDLTISINGTFSFVTAVRNGSAYSVTIKTLPPTLSQTCTVVNSNGTINNAPVTNVTVNSLAVPPRFAIDPSGQFAYATNYLSPTISVYKIETTGTLTAGAAVATGTNPNSITIHPFDPGKFVYAANYGSANISAYKIGTEGALTDGSTAGTENNPYSVTIIPSTATLSGKYAYAANFGFHTISVYAIHQTSGALSLVTTVAAGTNPHSVTIDPSGKFAYVSNAGSNNISVYAIHQPSGALINPTVVEAGTNPAAVSIIPSTATTLSGKYAYVANTGSNTISVYKIDETTGALTAPQLPISTQGNPSAIAIDKTGKFALTANYSDSSISSYTINQTTGVLVLVSTLPTGTNPYLVTIDPTGQFAYTANVTSNNVSSFSINAGTGALTQVNNPPISAGKNPYMVTINPAGTFAYVLNAGTSTIPATISVYAIDGRTGALTAVPTP